MSIETGGWGVMGSKRTIHVEIDHRTLANTDGIEGGLIGLARQAEDSHDFEDMLNKAIQSIYQTMPDGIENYGEHGKCGRVWISRFNNRDGHGKANIEFTSSSSSICGYAMKALGTIDLREKTFALHWQDDGHAESIKLYQKPSESFESSAERYMSIPAAVVRDTERVLECLGLQNARKPVLSGKEDGQ